MASPPQVNTFTSNLLPKVAYGKGSWIYDQNGREYLDASGGAAIFCLGHGDERVNAAIQAQLGRIAQGYRSQFNSDPLEGLTTLIGRKCGGGLENIVYVTGGSEAVESCLKIALQYQQAVGQTRRTRFIARERSYHGNTLGALSVSGHMLRRSYYEGSLLPVSFVSAANAYRPVADEMVAHAVAELEAEIVRVGPENVCAFIFEPVVGAAGCVVPAPDGYAQAMHAVCQKYGVLLIADEVMCGVGRVGTWRALAHDGVTPDLMAIAKGLGAGYIPLGAAVYQNYIADAIGNAYGAPMTGHTFTAHTTACAAALAVQTIIEEEQLVERVNELGDWFGQSIRSALADHPYVGDVRGRGFFWGVELVEDRVGKAPFSAEKQMATVANNALRCENLLAYPVTTIADGINGDGILFAPAYNTTEDDLTEMIARLARALNSLL